MFSALVYAFRVADLEEAPLLATSASAWPQSTMSECETGMTATCGEASSPPGSSLLNGGGRVATTAMVHGREPLLSATAPVRRLPTACCQAHFATCTVRSAEGACAASAAARQRTQL